MRFFCLLSFLDKKLHDELLDITNITDSLEKHEDEDSRLRKKLLEYLFPKNPLDFLVKNIMLHLKNCLPQSYSQGKPYL